jgi:hypothetical protein
MNSQIWKDFERSIIRTQKKKEKSKGRLQNGNIRISQGIRRTKKRVNKPRETGTISDKGVEPGGKIDQIDTAQKEGTAVNG